MQEITERIECKLLSLTHKVFTTTHNLITVQPPRSTRSSSLVTFARPSTSSSLRITDRSFWNQLPASLRQPRTNLSNCDAPIPLSGTSWASSIGSVDSPLSSSTTPHSFIPALKHSFSANPSHRSRSLLFFFRTDSTDSVDCLLLSLSVFTFSFFFFFSQLKVGFIYCHIVMQCALCIETVCM